MNAWHGWVVAFALAAIGVWREVTGYRTRAKLETRIAALEDHLGQVKSGTLIRQLREFCDHADTERIKALRALDEAEARLAEREKALGAALLECAQMEERVQRLLATRRT